MPTGVPKGSEQRSRAVLGSEMEAELAAEMLTIITVNYTAHHSTQVEELRVLSSTSFCVEVIISSSLIQNEQ